MGSQSPSLEPRPSRPPHDFEAIYTSSTPPWDIGRPQPAFEALATAGGLIGRVLDVGCGTGEHALLAASLGHEAVGVDIARSAIELAKAKGAERRLAVQFVEFDALRLAELGQTFDTVLDCGLFHVFDDDDRELFVASLASVLPDGWALPHALLQRAPAGRLGTPSNHTEGDPRQFRRWVGSRLDRACHHCDHNRPSRRSGLAGPGDSVLSKGLGAGPAEGRVPPLSSRPVVSRRMSNRK